MGKVLCSNPCIAKQGRRRKEGREGKRGEGRKKE
jgi:hypothetical protein